MLDHADFHEMMEPFGLFPPFTSLGDIIPTNSEYADLRKLRSALDQIAELQVQKEE